MKIFLRLWSVWSAFWFESFSPAHWRLFRVISCSIMFVAYFIRHLSLETFYSATRGIYISDPSRYVNMAYRWNLFSQILESKNASILISILHGFYLATLLLLIFGYWVRPAAILALILHISFIHANIGAVYGVDLIFTFLLFFMCLASDQVTSTRKGFKVWLSSVAFRFAQLQICIIYAFSGWEKLKGAAWWNGEALWSVIANPQMARFDFTWMSHFPLVLVITAYLTLIWEVYFPVLIWLPKWRIPALIMGVLFHLSIVGMMKIAFFGFLMISTYAVFLSDQEVKRVSEFLKRVPVFGKIAFREVH